MFIRLQKPLICCNTEIRLGHVSILNKRRSNARQTTKYPRCRRKLKGRELKGRMLRGRMLRGRMLRGRMLRGRMLRGRMKTYE
jgi:hypothetical protein